MSAEILRRAAALMRERAKDATPGRWVPLIDGVYVDPDYDDNGWLTFEALVVEIESNEDEPTGDTEHIASWHPAVALAVADLLDLAATHQVGFTPAPRQHLLAVVRAYLGEDA